MIRTELGDLCPVLVAEDVVQYVKAGAWAHLFRSGCIAVQHGPATLNTLSIKPTKAKEEVRRENRAATLSVGVEVEHRDRPGKGAVCESIVAIPGPARWNIDAIATGNVVGDGTVGRSVLFQARIQEIVHIHLSGKRSC